MSLPYLDLELMPRRTRPNVLGWLLLTAGLVAGMVVWSDFQEAQRDAALAEARLSEAKRLLDADRKPAARDARSDQASEAYLRRVSEVARTLHTPWGALFQAIEGATQDDIALLNIEPDPRKGLVKVGAEAKTPTAMLDYVERLQQSAPLQEVVLVSHQVRRDDPEQPIRFLISARWAP